jgi:hypothetical protein
MSYLLEEEDGVARRELREIGDNVLSAWRAAPFSCSHRYSDFVEYSDVKEDAIEIPRIFVEIREDCS